jgi:hypothetical protein
MTGHLRTRLAGELDVLSALASVETPPAATIKNVQKWRNARLGRWRRYARSRAVSKATHAQWQELLPLLTEVRDALTSALGQIEKLSETIELNDDALVPQLAIKLAKSVRKPLRRLEEAHERAVLNVAADLRVRAQNLVISPPEAVPIVMGAIPPVHITGDALFHFDPPDGKPTGLVTWWSPKRNLLGVAARYREALSEIDLTTDGRCHARFQDSIETALAEFESAIEERGERLEQLAGTPKAKEFKSTRELLRSLIQQFESLEQSFMTDSSVDVCREADQPPPPELQTS